MNIITVLSSLGGALAFLVSLTVIAKSIFRQVNATKENTTALNALSNKLDNFGLVQQEQGKDIAWLKGKVGSH